MNDGEYIANKKTHEVHIIECAWVDQIEDENMIIFDSLQEAFADSKYNPCGHCLAGINITSSNQINEETVGQNIELIAYYNWVSRGRPEGDPLTDWVKAESYTN